MSRLTVPDQDTKGYGETADNFSLTAANIIFIETPDRYIIFYLPVFQWFFDKTTLISNKLYILKFLTYLPCYIIIKTVIYSNL